ncbi:MAG: adenylate/guanylate cyclase domain-containing protein [Chloroflexi bacterium]|nr:adenylate/guanylate cyclase domain-containing protein [Chloroflexota bacterium]
MPSMPKGIITFLFTDIQGSTTLWEKHPTAMKLALKKHDSILRETIESNQGFVFKTVGDAFYAAFSIALDGLKAALEIQEKLLTEKWPDDIDIQVRIALHTGNAELRDNDYFGQALNRVARLEAAAHGGQILLSNATQEYLHDSLPTGITLRDMGSHNLKNLLEPERIYQVVSSTLPDDFPTLRTLDLKRNNLPVQATPFLGRKREQEGIIALIKNDDLRLLTLTGPGGTGKTRLLLQSMTTLVDDYQDGVFFVELASIFDPSLVAQSIADVLDINIGSGSDLIETLIDYLADKSLLLGLDNFEQIVDAGPIIAQLMSAAPNLNVLVSSRQILNIYGENEYPVPPLSLPDLSLKENTLAHFSENEAIIMFLQRAQAAKPQFQLTEANILDIAKICIKLDGLPLAIELAAARIKLLNPVLMLKKLENSFSLLKGGKKNLPARQQTMHGAVHWSYELLDEHEKALFLRLGIFRGGFNLEALEAIFGDELNEDIFDTLASLLDKSLIREISSLTENTRFSMLEVIREYAREELKKANIVEITAQRHADYYQQVVEDISGYTDRQHQIIGMEEVDNLRAVVSWAFDRYKPQIPLNMLLKIWMTFQIAGHLPEIAGWVDRVLEQREKLDDLQISQALRLAGTASMNLHQTNKGIAYYEESLALTRKIGDFRGEASCINNLASVYGDINQEYEKACDLLLRALEISRNHVQRPIQQGIVLANLSENTARLGKFDEAISYAEQSYQVLKSVNSVPYMTLPEGIIGDIYRRKGEFEKAREYLQGSIIHWRDWGGEPTGAVFGIVPFASFYLDVGEPKRAVQLLGLLASLFEKSAVANHQQTRVIEAITQKTKEILGTKSFDTLYNEGYSMPIENIYSLVLGE